VDATPVHGACGAWGCLAVGLLHPDDGLLFGGGWWLLFTQAISVVVIAALGFFPIYFLCWCLDMWGWLRCSLEEERKGIDMHVFKVKAYMSEDDDFVEAAIFNLPAEKPAAQPEDNKFVEMVGYLRKELNLSKTATKADVVDAAWRELELKGDASSFTLRSKAEACFKVLSAPEPQSHNDGAQTTATQEDSDRKAQLTSLQPPPATTTHSGDTTPKSQRAALIGRTCNAKNTSAMRSNPAATAQML